MAIAPRVSGPEQVTSGSLGKRRNRFAGRLRRRRSASGHFVGRLARCTLVGGTVLAAAAGWPGCGAAQVLFDPSVGYLTPQVNQPQPVLGTTEAFPLFPTTGLGFAGAPATYVGAGFGGGAGGIAQVAPATAPTRLTNQNPLLPPIVPGADPIQAGNNLAPLLIAQPSLGIATGFDDNPRQTHATFADSINQLTPGMIASVDSPHVQGVLSSSLYYLKYARATDQDTVSADGTGYALATLSPDHLYIDGRGSLFQVSPLGNGGFANPQLNGFTQSQSLLTTSITPIWRESFGDLIETDLRYNHSSISPLSGLSQSTTTGTLVAADTNQGTLTVALGNGGGVLASRLVVTAADVSSQSDAASSLTRGVVEAQYRINPEVALTAQGGYENLRYSNAQLAFPGPVAVLGTRLDLTPGSAISFGYGRDNGTWGFNGAARQTITPRTVLLLSYQQGINSQQQDILANLNASRLDPYGTIVNAETSLPLALANPELAYNQSGSVYRIEQARAALEHEFETDSLRLFAFFERDTSLVAGVTGDISRGAEITWFRAMTPKLTGGVGVGYASHTGGRVLTTNISLTSNLRTGLDAVLTYQFEDNISTVASTPSFTRNVLLAGLRITF
jgi:uncharacterized protein (PEP-CTERM system associated)